MKVASYEDARLRKMIRRIVLVVFQLFFAVRIDLHLQIQLQVQPFLDYVWSV